MSDEITVPTATQSEAENGFINDKVMTPLRTKQAIDALGLSQGVLASSSGAEMVGWNPGGSQSITTSAADKFSDFASARERGGGPLATTEKNTSVFTELFGAPLRGRIILDPVTYDIGANHLTFGLSNVWVCGVPGLTKITTTNLGLLWFTACSDVVLENIIFEVSAIDAGTGDYRGVINMLHAFFGRITFIRCVFRVPDAGLNAVKIIVEPEAMHDPGQEGLAESIHFYECRAEGTGRMGFEVQNHGHAIGDTKQRYFDIVWDGGVIQNTGLVDATNGQGVSFSGHGADCRVNTLFDNTSYCAIEGVGVSSSKFSGRVRNQMARPSDPLSFTNTLPMHDLTIEDFKTLGQVDGSVLLRSITGLTMRGNVLDLSGYVDITNTQKLRSTNDTYKTRHPTGVYINGSEAKNNSWSRLTLDRSETPSGAFSGIRHDNGANGNLQENLTYIHAGDGVEFDNIGGAFNNWIKDRRTADGVLADRAMVDTYQAFTTDADADDGEIYAMQRWEATSISITSGIALTATRTLKLPKNLPGLKRIKNATAGSQSIMIAKPGGGTTVTIPAGEMRTIAVLTTGVIEA